MYSKFFKELQSDIVEQLQSYEQVKKFSIDTWSGQSSQISQGGGTSMVLENGKIWEKAGVNFSEVSGRLPADMSKILANQESELAFYATGTSLVIHPLSPLSPTTHANLRYLKVGELEWFGGGMDLTPYYLNEKHCQNFHKTLKKACDKFDQNYYPKFKEKCDEYFYLPHRKEARGVGGIFFDYLGRDEEDIANKYFDFIQEIGTSLMSAYLPIIDQTSKLKYSDQQKDFQLYRRGRYAEFNLAYDRGTKFGLSTGGRTESILMSMPPVAHWTYNYEIAPESDEAKLMEVIKTPRSWI